MNQKVMNNYGLKSNVQEGLNIMNTVKCMKLGVPPIRTRKVFKWVMVNNNNIDA